MGAVKEWFGAYNMVFRHMKDTYGEEVLNRYIDYLADYANNDISAYFGEAGFAEAVKWFADNFRKDNTIFKDNMGEHTAEITVTNCAAFEYMLKSDNPYDQPVEYFCNCCKRLNERICKKGGCVLVITNISKHGSCQYLFAQEG